MVRGRLGLGRCKDDEGDDGPPDDPPLDDCFRDFKVAIFGYGAPPTPFGFNRLLEIDSPGSTPYQPARLCSAIRPGNHQTIATVETNFVGPPDSTNAVVSNVEFNYEVSGVHHPALEDGEAIHSARCQTDQQGVRTLRIGGSAGGSGIVVPSSDIEINPDDGTTIDVLDSSAHDDGHSQSGGILTNGDNLPSPVKFYEPGKFIGPNKDRFQFIRGTVTLGSVSYSFLAPLSYSSPTPFDSGLFHGLRLDLGFGSGDYFSSPVDDLDLGSNGGVVKTPLTSNSILDGWPTVVGPIFDTRIANQGGTSVFGANLGSTTHYQDHIFGGVISNATDGFGFHFNCCRVFAVDREVVCVAPSSFGTCNTWETMDNPWTDGVVQVNRAVLGVRQNVRFTTTQELNASNPVIQLDGEWESLDFSLDAQNSNNDSLAADFFSENATATATLTIEGVLDI